MSQRAPDIPPQISLEEPAKEPYDLWLFCGKSNKRYSTKDIATGWRRLIGCLKLQVIFRKRATNYRALLWKMTYEDKAS